MVLVRGDDSDNRAVTHAADLVRPSHGHLIILYVIVVPRSLPLDADTPEEAHRGEEALQRAERMTHLPRESVQAQVVQARAVGPALVHEAVRHEVQALVIGTVYPEKHRSFHMTEDLLYALEHAPCHVVLLRDPPRGAPYPATFSRDGRTSHERAGRLA